MLESPYSDFPVRRGGYRLPRFRQPTHRHKLRTEPMNFLERRNRMSGFHEEMDKINNSTYHPSEVLDPGPVLE